MLTTKSKWNGNNKIEQKQSKQHNPRQKSSDIENKNYYTTDNTTYMLEQRQHNIQQNKHNKQNSKKKFPKCFCNVNLNSLKQNNY